MKKTITLTNPRIKYARRVEAAKSEVRKYLKRERRRPLPEGADYWDFDCRFGDAEAEATSLHWSAISSAIDEIEKKSLPSFYVEILAKPGHRAQRTRDDGQEPSSPETA